MWLHDCWYQAGWSDDLAEGAILTRTILSQPLLLFRDSEGRPATLLDRCPHRFAPLSAGRLAGGVIECGYHGLAFGGSGACVRNPHGPVTKSMCARNYPTIERYDAIWVWMGDAEGADPAQIPDLSFIDDTPEVARVSGYMPTAANYQLLADNILDLSHTDYLHPQTLGGMMTGAKATTREQGDRVIVEWFVPDCEPSVAYCKLAPPGTRIDKWIEVNWSPPGILVLRTATIPAGTLRQEKDITTTVHSLTPETAISTHYFYCNVRRFLIDDHDFDESFRAIVARAFGEEDKPMLEAQQARMGTDELWSLKPLLLPIDNAAVRARRRLEALIRAEQQEAVT